METHFNFFKNIVDGIQKVQKDNLEENKNINLSISEDKGIVLIANGNIKPRRLLIKDKKLISEMMPRLMAEIFEDLIINHGASVTEIGLLIPKKTLQKKTIFLPVLFQTNQAFILKSGVGEGKLLVKSKREVGIHLEANSDGSFPLSCAMITQIKIDLKGMARGWSISKDLINPV